MTEEQLDAIEKRLNSPKPLDYGDMSNLLIEARYLQAVKLRLGVKENHEIINQIRKLEDAAFD